ncbi:MAG: hypothetical protein NT085_00855 [candidate division SR1 bacterium]|nr:hypothetical protein [candidate division SR1 bacterium]
MTTTGTHIFIVSDTIGNSTGIIFTIDKINPSVTGTLPASGQLITGSNTVVFTRTGLDTNMSGYYFSLTGTQQNTGNTTSLSRTLTLLNGSYIRYVIASDRAGNTGITQMIPFTIHVPYSGTATLTGPNTMYIGTQRFTKSNANILLWANEPVLYTITGSIDPSSITGTLSSLMTVSPLLTGGDGPKDIFISMVDGSGTILPKTFLVTLDTVAPIPTLTTPISGASLVGAFTLNWSAGADAAGLSGYQYLISPTSSFGTLLASGFTTTPSVTIPNLTIGMSGTLYRKVLFIDRLGNIGESVAQPFYYSGTVSDTTPDQFSFNTVTNATVNHIYGSNTVTITGINAPVLASITRGVLYISGVMVGTTGYIQNGWTVKIEMNSSIDYDTLVTSTLNIGGITALFRVTTETEEDANNNNDYTDISTDLSTTERLQIIAIFEALRDVYNGVKQDEFFSSFMVMLQSKIDDLGTSASDNSKRDALQYLYDLADQYDGNGGETNTTDIAGTSRIINGIYTAPNGKKYRITYDSGKKQFTSTNFITPKYYPTLDVLKYDIDRNNRLGSQYADAKSIKARWGRVSIDGTRQTSPYTAPNHKVFYFFKNTEGQISSYTFTTERYFDSLDATKEFIHNANLK